MSIESFEAFMTRLAEDAGLRDELRAQAPEGLNFEQLAQAAAARGFEFSAEELVDSAEGELSDEQLEAVAGGASFYKLDFQSNLQSAVQKVIGLSNMHKLGSTVFKF
jgi:predicted ribosomally synthesized peptide with nif11-like leader